MVGHDLVPVLRKRHDVVATTPQDLDVRNASSVNAAVHGCDLVCHLAALTDVDRCETEPDAAYRTNTFGTETIALACRREGAALVFASTIMVFDGRKPDGYTEFDEPDPVNHYGRSKHQAEVIVRRLVPEHYIVRAAWVFGGGRRDKKFVAQILDRARKQSELTVVDDKFGSPTYTVDLSHAIERLITTGRYGTYHSVGTGNPCSRFEFAKEIVRAAGVSCRLTPVGSERFPLPAPRPRMEGARNLHMELLGWDWMRPWKEALSEYVRTMPPARKD